LTAVGVEANKAGSDSANWSTRTIGAAEAVVATKTAMKTAEIANEAAVTAWKAIAT